MSAAISEQDPAAVAPLLKSKPTQITPPPQPRSSKFSKLFSKQKSAKKPARITESPNEVESIAPDDSFDAMPFKRDDFDMDSAKINRRRPPKGVQNWFDAIDSDSDDDFPEVVETPSEPSSGALPGFRPSLGPTRFKAAPTSIRSQGDNGSDYFHFNHPSRRWDNTPDMKSAPTHVNPLDDPHERSMLSLSSDDEDQASPSWADEMPPGLTSGSRDGRPQTADRARQSMMSMQTMVTSGTIPFVLSLQPGLEAPPLPESHPFTPPAYSEHVPTPAQESEQFLLPRAMTPMENSRTSGYTASPRLGTSHSDVPSFTSEQEAEPAHMMVVTDEEMVLLEMMRKKRAEMVATSMHPSPCPSTASKRKDKSPPELPGPSTQDPAPNSFGSLTLDGGDYIVFPCPPSFSSSSRSTPSPLRAPRSTRRANRSRSPAISSRRSPSPPISELEAIPYSGPLPLRQSTSSLMDSAKATSPPAYTSSDPYQLAPDIVDFSPFDLSLSRNGSVRYAPSLTTSLSSCQTPSYDSIKTPLGGSETGSVTGIRSAGTPVRKAFGGASALGIRSDESDEVGGVAGEVGGQEGKERPMSVAVDVMMAWGALGGMVA